MSAATFVLLVNPVSGKGGSLRVAQALEARLRERGHGVRLVETVKDPEDLRALCAGFEPSATVVCIGGDGTLLDYVNSVASHGPVAFYGMGTANVVRIEFGIPSALDAFVDMLEQRETVPLRLGRLQDGTRFLMMASLGFDAAVIAQVSQRLKNRLGKWAFVVAAFRSLWGYSYPMMEVSLDDGPPERMAYLIASRFRHYGGTAVLADQADPSSDHLEVVGLPKPGGLAMLGLIRRLLWGQTKNPKGLVTRSARRVKVVGSAPCQLDGSLCRVAVAEISVDTAVVPLIVPKHPR